MKKKYSYRLRPGYGSEELLLEFVRTGDATIFTEQLLEVLYSNDFYLDTISDVWMNDEVWIHLKSNNGQVLLTKDIWDMIFIIGKDNQKDIICIDKILVQSGLYEKETVDFSDYAKPK